MSTRCVVKVINNGRSIDLYHHCDGYPEGVGFCLLKLMKKYSESDYLDANWIVNKMIKNGRFETTFYNHSDIDYYYEMDFDKREVKCMSVDNWGDVMKILEHINLEYKEEDDVNIEEELMEVV